MKVRVDTCEGSASGSGFLLDDRTVVTNRHVVEDAVDARIETASGETIRATSLEEASGVDLGLVRLDRSSKPVFGLARRDPISGDLVVGVGFPRGGPLRISHARVVDYVAGSRFAVSGDVMRTSAEMNLGSSGGPVLKDGRVVGVAFALERATDYSLAIPTSTLRRRLGSFQPVDPPC